MSKLDIRLSYKNCCILKHALRDKINQKEDLINTGVLECFNNDLNINKEKFIKELEEEKRALKAITDEIEECGFRHNRQIFKK